MATIRVPFCVTTPLPPQFMLDENFAEPNGVKSVLFDISNLHISAKKKSIDVPDIGPVQMYVYNLTGAIEYMCNAFPIVQSEAAFSTQEQFATFNGETDNASAVFSSTSVSNPLGWVSAAGCVNVDKPIGGGSTLDELPLIESVTVTDFAVANNEIFSLYPSNGKEECDEERKRIIKWRGCFVINTV